MRIGIDIGGTKTDAVLIDASNQVLQRYTTATGRGADAVLEGAVNAIEQLLRAGGLKAAELEAIGVGVPGTITAGVVNNAVNLEVARLDLRGELQRRFPVAISVENDVKAAALGAYRMLQQNSNHSLVFINFGTGLAAGIVVNGRLWRGFSGAAGEIGQIVVDPQGPYGSDGLRGGLEAMASGSGIARQWHGPEGGSAQELLAAADAGDAAAILVRDRFIAAAASAIRIIALTVDPENIVIGGGLSRLGEPFLAAVLAELGRQAAESAVVAELDLPRRISLAPTGVPVAAIGAALLGGEAA